MTLLRCARSRYVTLTLYEEILEKRRYKQGHRRTQDMIMHRTAGAEQSKDGMILLKTRYERTKVMPIYRDELSQEGRRN